MSLSEKDLAIFEKARTGRVIFFDTETTGMSDEDEVCQIAAVEFAAGVETRRFNEYLRISFPMPWDAEEIHGIGDALLAERGVSAAEGIEAFFRFVGDDALLVGHNIRFDFRMLNQTAAKAGVEFAPEGVTTADTCRLAKKIVPGLDCYRLGPLLAALHLGRWRAC